MYIAFRQTLRQKCDTISEAKQKSTVPLSRGIARMVELFTSPRELSHSAPDLVHQSAFSHQYDDQGEPAGGDAHLPVRTTATERLSQPQPQATPMSKARHATPRGVKQRHELRTKMKLLRTGPDEPEYEEYTADKSESHSSSGGEGQLDDRSLRSPPDGAFDADDLEALKVKGPNELKPIPISRIVSKPPTATETAPRLPPSTRSSILDRAAPAAVGSAVRQPPSGMRQWTASRSGPPQLRSDIDQPTQPAQPPGPSPVSAVLGHSQATSAFQPTRPVAAGQSFQATGVGHPTQPQSTFQATYATRTSSPPKPGAPVSSPMYNLLFPTSPPKQQAQPPPQTKPAEAQKSAASSDVVNRQQVPKMQFPQKALVIERKTSSSSSAGDSPEAVPHSKTAPFPRTIATSQTSGIGPHVLQAPASASGVRPPLTQPVKFTPGLSLRTSGARDTGMIPQHAASADAKPRTAVPAGRTGDRMEKIRSLQEEKLSQTKSAGQRPSGPPPPVPVGSAHPAPQLAQPPSPVAPQRTKHLQKKAAAASPITAQSQGQNKGQLSFVTFGGLLKDAGVPVPVVGPGGQREVHVDHTVESGDNFRKEQFSRTEFQQNRSSNVAVTSSGQLVEQRQLLKQERTVTVMSKTSKTTSSVSSGKLQPNPVAGGVEKKKRKDKFDIDSLVAKNAALAMSEDELDNVSDYDNFTDTNLEVSSDDGGSTTETGDMTDGRDTPRALPHGAAARDLDRVAELAPDLAHAAFEREINQKPPEVPPEQRGVSGGGDATDGAVGMRQVNWGEATPKDKESRQESRERRRSIKELVDNFESKMSPFS